MRYLWSIIMAFTASGNATSLHTYVLHTAAATGVYSFDINRDDSSRVLYEVKTQGTSADQPYGVTTDLALGLPEQSLLSYSTRTLQKFFSSDVEVVLNGNTATLTSQTNDEIHAGKSHHTETTLALLAGSKQLVVWDPVLLPEMLADRAQGVRSCLHSGTISALSVRPLTLRPHGLQKSAKGIKATCGSASAEIWYEVGSRTVLVARSTDDTFVWKLKS